MRHVLTGVGTALLATLIYGIAAIATSYFAEHSFFEPEGGWLKLFLTVPFFMVILSSPLTITLGAVLGAILPRLPRHLPLSWSIAAGAAIAFAATLLLFGAIHPVPINASLATAFISVLREACYAALVGGAFTFFHRTGA